MTASEHPMSDLSPTEAAMVQRTCGAHEPGTPAHVLCGREPGHPMPHRWETRYATWEWEPSYIECPTPDATPSGGDGIEEMSETAVLRVRLQWTEADLEHVAAERDGLREAVTSLAVRFETLAEALHSVPAADAYDDAGQSLRAVLAERGQG